MLILKENEVCPYTNNCPYNESHNCNGGNPNRNNVFTCEYVVNGQIITDQPNRLSKDLTGKMKIIME